MKKRLNIDHALAKKIGYSPKYFEESTEMYIENDKKLYIENVDVTNYGKKFFRDFLIAVHNKGFKIFIPQAPLYLKKVIRKYNLPFDLWVTEDEKLCLDNYAKIHLHWLEIKSNTYEEYEKLAEEVNNDCDNNRLLEA